MQKGDKTVQICPDESADRPTHIRLVDIRPDPEFPINAPYLNRLHYSRSHPADYLHYHHTMEIGLCMEGSGIFYIGSRVYRYEAGDVSVIAPEVAHIAQSDSNAISGWQFLDIDLPGMTETLLAGALPKECGYSGVVRKIEQPALAPLVHAILEELRYTGPDTRQMVRLMVGEMALIIRRLSTSHRTQVFFPDTMNEVAPAVLYIVNHYQEPMTLEQLAAMCSASVSSFRRQFEHNMNTSPFEYLYHVRIQAAVNLLRTTGLPVSEIASRVGYPTLSSFNRHFRRIMGSSPRELRACLPVKI